MKLYVNYVVTVKLRKRINKNGTVSLRLDTFLGYEVDPTGKRRAKRERITLPFHLVENPKSIAEHKANLDNLAKAEKLRREKEQQINASLKKPFNSDQLKQPFVPFFNIEIHKALTVFSTKTSCIKGAQKYFFQFERNNVLFEEITTSYCQRFMFYLKNSAVKKNGTPLSDNTIRAYFNTYKTILDQAVNQGYLSENPAAEVELPKIVNSTRTFLNPEEFDVLAQTPCMDTELELMFLISCQTGLRFDDIKLLKWSDLKFSKSGASFQLEDQKGSIKRKYLLDVALSGKLQAQSSKSGKCFPTAKMNSTTNQLLKEWGIQAGLQKKLNFLSGRHTYAVQALMDGMDIKTLQLHLDHKDIRSTMVYQDLLIVKKPQMRKPKNVLLGIFNGQQRKSLGSDVRQELRAYNYSF